MTIVTIHREVMRKTTDKQFINNEVKRMKMAKRAYLVFLGILILIFSTATVLTTSINAAVTTTPVQVCPVSVTFVISSDWGTGCLYSVTIKNKTTQVISWNWKLSWKFIGSQQIMSIWNMTVTQSGSYVTVTPISNSNASIPAGGTFNFGFTVTGTGRRVTDVRFNGIPVPPEPGVIW